jgi:hypothetical protein
MLRKLYSIILKKTIISGFEFFQKFGFHVTLNHYFQPVPDTRTLRSTLWEKPSELPGIDLRGESQIELLHSFRDRFLNEYSEFPLEPTDNPNEFYLSNDSFEFVDAEILYSMIRHFKPNKMIEIGSGRSTFVSGKALMKNKEEGDDYHFTAFEPYPGHILKHGAPGLSELRKIKIEDVPLEEFTQLKENDILFIDSTHVLKIGSDVQYEYLEIIPRLAKGVVVHIHDIFLPYEYLKEWVMDEHRFWTEQYLLQAFLSHNESFEVLWGSYYMNRFHPEELEKCLPTFKKNSFAPASFWIRKIK